LTLNAPSPSAPFFTPAPKDTAALVSLSRELDLMAAQCVQPACDEVHYARGLVGLFESREAARTSFRRVSQATSSSSVAASSSLWLKLLEGGGLPWLTNEAQEQAFLEITAELVREWVDRKLVELRESKQTSHGAAKSDTPAGEMPASFLGRHKHVSESEDSIRVQTLQRQMRERDGRIAELSAQLEALKAIDREANDRRKLPRPPAVLTPATTDRHP